MSNMNPTKSRREQDEFAVSVYKSNTEIQWLISSDFSSHIKFKKWDLMTHVSSRTEVTNISSCSQPHIRLQEMKGSCSQTF